MPRHAVGPELTQLFVGSEGTLGVITRATLQLVPLPAERRFAAVAFPSVGAGIGAIRRALQAGHRPSVVRMYDEEATRLAFAPVVGEELSGVYTVLAFEGEPEAARLEERRTLELAARGRRRGARPGARRSAGGTGATTSTTRPTSRSCPRSGARSTSSRRYARIEAVYDALHTRGARALRATTGLELRMHFSHWYPWGTMIYGRFVVPDGGPDALALHDRIWEDGMTAALDAGGVMNDHHGVGIKLGPYMRRQHGARARRDAADQGRAGPQRRHEPRQDGPVGPRRGGARWRSRWRCTTGCGPSRSRRRSRGSVAAATTGSRSRASRRSTTPTRSRACSTSTGSSAGASVTLMTGGRDLVHEDHYVRLASVQYVKDCLSLVASLGGKILTVVPSTVGKVVPMASPEEEWRWCVEGLKECQAHAEEVGVRIGVEPLNRFETYFINRADQAVAMAKDVGGNCGVALDIFHMNIEEADWAQAIRDTGDHLVDFHVADNNRMPPGQGAIDWEAIVAGARRHRLRRLPDGRVRRPGRPHAALAAHGDRRRVRGRRQPGDGAVPARPRHRRAARALLRPVRPGLDRPPAPGARRRRHAGGLSARAAAEPGHRARSGPSTPRAPRSPTSATGCARSARGRSWSTRGSSASRGCAADVTREEVARAGGHELDGVRAAGSRGAAVDAHARGRARASCLRLYAEGRDRTACCAWAAPRGRCSAPPRCTRCRSACRS